MNKQNKQRGKEVLASYGLHPDDFQILTFLPGDKLFDDGNTMTYIYFVLSGSAEVRMYSKTGKCLNIIRMKPDDIIGDLELMLERRQPDLSVQAITKMVCVALPYSYCLEEVKKNIEFSNRVGVELSKKVLRNTAHLFHASCSGAKERLAQIIYEENRDGIYRGPATDLATKAGLSYRHTLRVIKELEEEGIISVEGKTYTVMDMDRLERLTYLY